MFVACNSTQHKRAKRNIVPLSTCHLFGLDRLLDVLTRSCRETGTADANSPRLSASNGHQEHQKACHDAKTPDIGSDALGTERRNPEGYDQVITTQRLRCARLLCLAVVRALCLWRVEAGSGCEMLMASGGLAGGTARFISSALCATAPCMWCMLLITFGTN